MKIQNAYGLKCNLCYSKAAENKKHDRYIYANKPCVNNQHKACEITFSGIYSKAKNIGTNLMGKIKNIVTPIGKEDDAVDIMQDIGREIASEKISNSREQTQSN